MKTRIILNFSLFLLLAGCGNNLAKTEETAMQTPKTVTTEQVAGKTFDELFSAVDAAEIDESVFNLVGRDYTVITSGSADHYNSMVAGWGGWGILFEKPTTWCMLRANRYTLELIRKNGTYTMAYFDDNFKDQIMQFGMSSGRDGDKMQNTKLIAIQTPSGSMAWKEAKLIVECRLTELTTVSPDDFTDQSSKDFVTGAYAEAGEYHKLVFGEITAVWKRK
jgi:flavin reductase (DIM6/NTAB) family NADH-FMN oxidoreductase RutF